VDSQIKASAALAHQVFECSAVPALVFERLVEEAEQVGRPCARQELLGLVDRRRIRPHDQREGCSR
jgi:hypothetical protein